MLKQSPLYMLNKKTILKKRIKTKHLLKSAKTNQQQAK
ncbi:internalin-J [Listeria monocytogenes]|nr:internalin-J [Listeria monocytogenes]